MAGKDQENIDLNALNEASNSVNSVSRDGLLIFLSFNFIISAISDSPTMLGLLNSCNEADATAQEQDLGRKERSGSDESRVRF